MSITVAKMLLLLIALGLTTAAKDDTVEEKYKNVRVSFGGSVRYIYEGKEVKKDLHATSVSFIQIEDESNTEMKIKFRDGDSDFLTLYLLDSRARGLRFYYPIKFTITSGGMKKGHSFEECVVNRNKIMFDNYEHTSKGKQEWRCRALTDDSFDTFVPIFNITVDHIHIKIRPPTERHIEPVRED